MTDDSYGPMTNAETNPDPETGTRRLDLWRESASGGQWGDMARGYGYSARYLSDDEHGCAEIAVYVVENHDDGEPCGFYGVEEMTTIGPAILEDGIWRPDDTADIDYEWADARCFDTLEAAQKVADDHGQRDLSWALHLRKRGDT